METKDSQAVCQTKRGLARQQKFLEIAETLFLEKGYAATSVNEIVALSGGSLGTLYRLFGNKLGLFEEVFKRKTKEAFKMFEADFWSEDLEQSLLKFGSAMQKISLSADSLAIYRLVITENNLDQGEIQKIFYKYGPQTATKMLADYLQKQAEDGKLDLMDAYLAAAQFLEMIKGPFTYRRLFGETVTEAEVEKALIQAIQLFLKGSRSGS